MPKYQRMSPRVQFWLERIGLVIAGIGLGIGAGFILFPRAAEDTSRSLRLTDENLPLISPLLACNIDAQEPTEAYDNLRSSLEKAIADHIESGDILRAGIYVRSLDNGFWTAVNGDDQFTPGSLMKIITLMVYLVEADADPSILSQELIVTPTTSSAVQNITPAETAEVGGSYTVKELLELMIVHSDNAAKQTLAEHFDPGTYNQILSALEIPGFTDNDADPYTISPRLYSRLIRILYNSTLLSQPSSEFALELMAQSEYHDALIAGIDPASIVAHKFGEIGTKNEDGSITYQHHDCGIVYSTNPYAICVMTEGNNLTTLAGTIASLARTADTFMQSR